jgi:CheY-like chemotaxis protein
VLLVEDEPLVAALAQDILEDAGHQVVAVADRLGSAIEAAKIYRPQLALVDLRLADGDTGPDVAAALAHDFGVAVVYATGTPHLLDNRPVLGPIIQKPFRPEVLLRAIAAR